MAKHPVPEPKRPRTAPLDVAIPLAFPDYLIHVDVQTPEFTAPLIGKVKPMKLQAKLPQLGHAGVLFINGAKGTTKYYEYGRYPPSGALGRVQKQSVPDVKIGPDGHPTRDSLLKTLMSVSTQSGQHGRIEAAYIVVPGKFSAMLSYALKREAENANPKRRPYDLTENSCMHFAKWTVESAGKKLPSGLVPSPADWIEDVQDQFPDLEYLASKSEVNIHFTAAEAGSVPEWAKQKSWLKGVLEGDR